MLHLSMITDIWGALQEVATGFIDFLTDLFTSVFTIFYTPGVGEASGEFTIMGYFLLIGVVTGLVWFVIGFIRNLIKLR